MEERYDVAIIGSGPAGLSAAVILKIRNKKVIIFGSKNLSAKLEKAHEIQNYLGFPAIKGEDLMKNFQNHISSLGIEITEDSITACYSLGDYFSLTSRSNKTYIAKSVILASGVNFGKPYKGEEEFLGRGVSYCATCDAPLYKGKKVVVIAQTSKEEEEAKFLSEVCEKVYFIPLYKEETNISDVANIEIIKDEIVSIEGMMKANKLVLKNQEITADGFFILRDSVSPKQLVPGLELDENHVKVNRNMETNLKGLFACGDIAGLPYQYIKSAGEGNIAALSAVKYLSK
ncbi:MAG: NAD(P)/FAD-dependent oxidoreductase [Spirochaetia bacterium]|nr:NAD(P)/FAD-dependent oxidoreductase [Spirochaetia bacterium]